MNTTTNALTHNSDLRPIRADIHTSEVKLVREAAGRWVAIDTLTGDKVGLAVNCQRGHGKAKHWVLCGGEEIQDRYVAGLIRSRFQGSSDRVARLQTIIAQWVRGYA